MEISVSAGQNNLFPTSKWCQKGKQLATFTATEIPRAREPPAMLGRPVCGAGGNRAWRFAGPGAGCPHPGAPRPPEEALAAFAGHGVEVEASGSVPADAADPGDVPVEVSGRVGEGRAGSHGLHVWESTESRVLVLSGCHTFTV